MIRKARLFSLLTFLVVVGQSVSGDQTTLSVTNRIWHPILSLGGQGAVKVGDAKASRAVVKKIKESTKIVRAVLDGKIKADESTKEFWEEVTEDLANLDLDSLYEDFPIGPEDGWRRLRLKGEWTGKEYSIVQAKNKSSLALSVDKSPGVSLYEGALDLGSKPVNEGKTYLTNLEAKIGLGRTSVTQLLRMSSLTMKVVESEANTELGAKRARPSKSMRGTVLKENSTLNPHDVELLASFAQSFPKFFKALSPVFEVRDLVEFKPVAVPGAPGLCQVNFKLKCRNEVLEKAYPEIHDYLEDLGPLIKVEGVLKDGQNRRLGSFSLDTGSQEIRFRTLIKDGAVLPVDDMEKPVFSAALDPTAVRRLRFSVRANALINVNGININIANISLGGDYRRVRDDAMVTTRFKIPPKVTVSGQAYGVVPTWLIDVFIPSNIGELATNFLKTLTRGNGGRGFEARTFIHRGATGQSLWHLKQQSEVLNNALIQIGARLMNHKVIPDEDTREELKTLARKILFGIDSDASAMLRTLPPTGN
ncbi:MAG: hypothetical protein P1V97_09725 [Planctomycetota bacterium]|nr:hypothetical protein [Planctomycetota bacterium]